MKKSILFISVIIILLFRITPLVLSCSMMKVTIYGKTIVGNNEDYWNPNTRIWFEHAINGGYGAVYVGYDDFWPQGGMNQAGLVFDGFSMPYLAINDTIGKKELGIDFLKEIIRSCVNVEDVKNYFSQYNLSGLETSMFLFVDKTGKYLVVEGDSLIIGNNRNYVLSNFYPSLVKDESEIDIPFYHKGKSMLDCCSDTSINFCSSVMDTMHQERDWGGGTMYTTIYNLNEGIIYLYFFHDYSHGANFYLNQELEKGDHVLVIPELFPENKKGLDFTNSYNAVNREIDLFKNDDILNDSTRYYDVTSTLFRKDLTLISKFADKINEIGNMWLEKKNYSSAINVFKINVKLLPELWSMYDALANAYMENNQNALALANFEISVRLNPDNLNGIQQIERLKKLLKNE